MDVRTAVEPGGRGVWKEVKKGGEVKARAAQPRRKGRVSVSDRSLHGLTEALLIHGGVDLTGQRTAPPLMMAAKVGVWRKRWSRLACSLL